MHLIDDSPSMTGLSPEPYELKVILLFPEIVVPENLSPHLKLTISPELNPKELTLERLFHAADSDVPELPSFPPILFT
jgi:hypothetical protein